MAGQDSPLILPVGPLRNAQRCQDANNTDDDVDGFPGRVRFGESPLERMLLLLLLELLAVGSVLSAVEPVVA